nr:helix-turn-helix transcriptional regulator [Moraxella osloensis]
MKSENFLDNRGLRVKDERTRLRLSQADVAEKCGVSRVQWGRYEREENRLDGDVLKKFGELGADIDYILTGKLKTQTTNKDNSKDYSFSGDYHQLQGTERKLYQMAYASDWVDEAERDNAPIKLHPALKQMLTVAISSGGLSQAGVFNLVDGLALFAKNGESIFLTDNE